MCSPQRWPALPDLPTLAEPGFKDIAHCDPIVKATGFTPED